MKSLNLQSQIDAFDYIGNSVGSAFSPHNSGVWSAAFRPPKRITSWDGNAQFNTYEESTGYAQLSGVLNGLGTNWVYNGTNASDGSTAKTIEFWMNSDAVTYNTSGKQYVFSYGNKFEIYINHINDFGIWKLELGIEQNGNLVCNGTVPLDENIKPGKWIHVVFTNQVLPDSTNTLPNLFWRLNVNGKRVVLTPYSNPDYLGFDPIVKFGTGGLNDVSNRFSGMISNFLIYKFVKYPSLSFSVENATNSLPAITDASDAFFRGPILRHEYPRTTPADIATPSRSLSAGFIDTINPYKSFTPLVVNTSPFKKKDIGVPTEYVRGITSGSVYFDGNNSGIKLKTALNSSAFGSTTNWTFGSWVYPEMHYDNFGLLDVVKQYTVLSISVPGINQTSEIVQGIHVYLKYNTITARFDIHIVLKGDNNLSSMKKHLVYDTKSGHFNQWSSFRIISESNQLYVIWNGITIGTEALSPVTNGNWSSGEQTIGTRKYSTTYIDTFKGYIGHCFYTSGSFFQTNEGPISSLIAGTGVLNYNYESDSLFTCLTGIKDDYGTGSFCLSSTDLSVYDIARKNTIRSVGTVYSSDNNTASSLSSYPSYEFNKTGYISVQQTDYDLTLNLNHDAFTIESWINVSSLTSSDVNFSSTIGQGIFQIGTASSLNTFSSSVTSINNIFATYKIGMSLSIAGGDSANSLVIRTLKSDNTVEEQTINYRRQRDYYVLPSGSSPVVPSCLEPNRWHHIALTYTPKAYNDLNSSNVSGFFDLYVDGIKQNNTNGLPVTKDTIINGKSLIVGGHCNSSQLFSGKTEEVKYIKGVVKYKENSFIPVAAQSSTTPVAKITVDNQTINTATGAYLVVDNTKVNTFTLNLNGVNGVTFVDYFDSSNKNNCKLSISTTNNVYSSATEVKVGNSVVLSSNKDELFTFYYFNTGSLLLGVAPTNLVLGELITAPAEYATFSLDKYEILNYPKWSPRDWFFTNSTLPNTIPQYDLTTSSVPSMTGSATGIGSSAWNSPISYYKIATGSNGNTLKSIYISAKVVIPASSHLDQADQSFLPVSYQIILVQKNTGEVYYDSNDKHGFAFDVRKQKHLTGLKNLFLYGADFSPYASHRLVEFEGSATREEYVKYNASFVCDGDWDAYIMVQRPFINSNFNFIVDNISVSPAAKTGSVFYNNYQKTPLILTTIKERGIFPEPDVRIKFERYGKSTHVLYAGSKVKTFSINNISMPSKFASQTQVVNGEVALDSWYNSLYNLDYQYYNINASFGERQWWRHWNVFGWLSFNYTHWYYPYYGYGSGYFERPSKGSCDLTSVPQIEDFYASGEQLSALDITGCNNLKHLICSGNLLSSLALNDKSNLEYLRCGNNPDLTVSLNANMAKLHTLHASKTKLNSLNLTSDFSALSSLKFVRLVDNQMSTANIDSILIAFNQRGVRDGELLLNGNNGIPSASGLAAKSSLISKGWTVETSTTGFPNTVTLLAGLTSIPSIYALPDEGSTSFTFNQVGTQNINVNLQNCENLLGLYFSGLPNNKKIRLNLTGTRNLQNVSCTNSQISSIDFESSQTIVSLNCGFNSLTSLSALQWASLETLNCEFNQLTGLNTTGMTNVNSIDCSNNKLTTLEVIGKTKLKTLDISYNTIFSLILSNNVNLKTLIASNNLLEDLSITNCFNLNYINFRNCYLPSDKIDALLSLLVTYGLSNGYIDISGTNELPGTSGLSHIGTLEARGWTCIYNAVAPVSTDSIGNTIAGAQNLTLGTPISSTIDYPGDSDWYKITGLVVGNIYTIYVDGITLRKPFLTLRTSAGVFKEHADNTVGMNPRKIFIADESTAIFDVKGSNGKIGKYSIIIEENIPVDPVPTITTTFSAISAVGNHLCTSVGLSAFEERGSSPYYQTPIGGLFFASYRSEGAFAEFEYQINRLKNPNQYSDDYPEDWGMSPSSEIKVLSPIYVQAGAWYKKYLACIATPAGYTWILNDTYEGGLVSNIIKYSDLSDEPTCPFNVQWLTKAPYKTTGGTSYTTTTAFNVVDYIVTDEFTGTTSTTGTATLNAPTSGTINFPKDRDWIKVNLNAGTNYFAGVCPAETTSWWAFGDLNLGLRNSSGQEIMYSEDQQFFNDQQTRLNPVISFTVPANGNYYLDVGAVGGQAALEYNVLLANSTPVFDVVATAASTNNWGSHFTTKNYANPLVGLKFQNNQISIANKNEVETLHLYSKGDYNFVNYPSLKQLSVNGPWPIMTGSFNATNCPLLTGLATTYFNYTNAAQLKLDGIKTQLYDFDCSGCENLNVNSLNIPSFTNLKHFKCARTNVNGILNIGTLPLRTLNCSNSKVQGINNIPTSLVEFRAYYNPSFGGTLDFTSCTNLKTLQLNDTTLTDVKFNGLTQLVDVDCSDSNLTSLNLTGLTNLISLYADGNQINGTVTFASLNQAITINLESNLISSILNLNGATKLERLNVKRNNLTSLVFASANTKLVTLNCSINSLTTLTFTDSQSSIITLDCSNNNLTSIDTLKLKGLQSLDCQANSLTTLDLTNCNSLYFVNASFNSGLVSLTLPNVLTSNVLHFDFRGTQVDISLLLNYAVTKEAKFGILRASAPSGGLTSAQLTQISLLRSRRWFVQIA